VREECRLLAAIVFFGSLAVADSGRPCRALAPECHDGNERAARSRRIGIAPGK